MNKTNPVNTNTLNFVLGGLCLCSKKASLPVPISYTGADFLRFLLLTFNFVSSFNLIWFIITLIIYMASFNGVISNHLQLG